MMFSNMLWMFLPLAAAPVLLHFYLRKKFKKMDYPSVMLFTRHDPKLRSRQKLQDIFLLILRIMLLALLLFIASRPYLEWLRVETEDSAVAIVIDNSASMGGMADSQSTKLQQSIQAARSLLSRLSGGSMVAIVTTVPDEVSSTHEVTFSRDKDHLNYVLDQIRETHSSGLPYQVIGRVYTALGQNAQARNLSTAIHVFSDLQVGEWALTDVGLEKPSMNANLIIHKIESREFERGNVAIDAVIVPDELIHAQREFPIRLTLRNTSGIDADILLHTDDDQGTRETRNLVIPAGEQVDELIGTTPETPGVHWMRIAIEGDSLPGDNHAVVGYVCAPASPVPFLGQLDEYGLLPSMVSPSGTGLYTAMVPAPVDPADLKTTLERDSPTLIVATYDRLQYLNDGVIESYVEQGGSLLVVPETASTNTSVVFGEDRLSLGTIKSKGQMRPANTNDPIWGMIRGEKFGSAIFGMNNYHPLVFNFDATPLFVEKEGNAVLFAVQDKGEGKVFYSGFAFHPLWTSLVTDTAGMGLVLLHNMAHWNPMSRANTFYIDAGTPPGNPASFQGDVAVSTILGDAIQGQYNVTSMPILPMAGFYEVQFGEKTMYVSTKSAPNEGLPEYVNGNKLEVLKFDHKISALSRAELEIVDLAAGDTSMQLIRPLIIALILFWLLECWVGNVPSGKLNPFGRKGSESTEKIRLARKEKMLREAS
ncbi:MAG: BatA and WFA domain-containing protein [Verrucomicrobiota bacterium]